MFRRIRQIGSKHWTVQCSDDRLLITLEGNGKSFVDVLDRGDRSIGDKVDARCVDHSTFLSASIASDMDCVIEILRRISVACDEGMNFTYTGASFVYCCAYARGAEKKEDWPYLSRDASIVQLQKVLVDHKTLAEFKLKV